MAIPTAVFLLKSASELIPPHKITHPDKLAELTQEFRENGWGLEYPVLVGYWYDNPNIEYKDGHIPIQLITGTHRHGAGENASIPIPVIVYEYEDVYAVWGLPGWNDLLQAPLYKDVLKR